nr:FAD-dependent oxidoreductase domain-containing protein 1-like [Leptinotarsa decemlineata]
MLGNFVRTTYKVNRRHFHKSRQLNEEFENPIFRTFRILRDDIQLKNRPKNRIKSQDRSFPRHADIVIVGGGAIGSSIAYWLKEKSNYDGVKVVVLEKDPTYKKCSTALSVGGLRQQFSLAENIQMSLYGAEFLRTLKKRFGPDADVNFHPHGYLLLANEEGAPLLEDNNKLQRELGAVNVLLTKEKLKERFPYMDVSDVALGCLGLEKEGWFDPWSLLTLLKNGAKQLGAQYVTGEAVDFLFEEKSSIMVQGVDQGTYEGTNTLVVSCIRKMLSTVSISIKTDNLQVTGAWSGFYEYNTFDMNGIIGPHPYFLNMYIASGFSGHGIQQAPAVGRAVAELILDGRFQTIDLTRLGFDRLIVDKPMYEVGII